MLESWEKGDDMHFSPKDPDFDTSPYTGMTRRHWIDAGKYVLEGVFRHVKTMDDPVLVPRYETEVTYPNSRTPAWKVQAEYYEGLARSFFIAAPLIAIEPDMEISGKNLREYYKDHILRSCTPGDEQYVLSYSDMDRDAAPSFGLHTYQQTVETCAIVIGLVSTKKEIWDTYSREEKDRIASFIRDYAEGTTATQNWRLFNMLDLAFLDMMGYDIDASIMREHAQAILAYYAGQGWYRDGHTFDYYSAWAFQVYAPIWCRWYGYEKEPYLAHEFENNSNELMKTYDRMFDADGHVTMWGRSSIYRNAATAAFAANFNLRNPACNPGLARRISYSTKVLRSWASTGPSPRWSRATAVPRAPCGSARPSCALSFPRTIRSGRPGRRTECGRRWIRDRLSRPYWTVRALRSQTIMTTVRWSCARAR